MILFEVMYWLNMAYKQSNANKGVKRIQGRATITWAYNLNKTTQTRAYNANKGVQHRHVRTTQTNQRELGRATRYSKKAQYRIAPPMSKRRTYTF